MKVTVRDPGMVTLLAPAFDLTLGEFELEWAVAKPTNLSDSHGIDITVERLMEMASSYNPEGIEAAPINFDHDPGGPAHGWVESLEVREGLLWVRPVELSPDVVAGIRGGRYRRASIELTTKHPETGGWYLNGLAVLGNAKPAIKGLPPLRLSAPRYVIQLGDEPPAEVPEAISSSPRPEEPAPLEPPDVSDNPLPEDIPEEQAMSEKKETPEMGAEELGLFRKLVAALRGEPRAEVAQPPVGLTAEEVDARIEAKVQAGINAGLAEQTVTADLRAVDGKATPGAIAKARPALLKAKTAGDEETYAAILGVLAEQDASYLLDGEIASEELTSEGKSLAVSGRAEVMARNGIDAKREAELARKYGLSKTVQ